MADEPAAEPASEPAVESPAADAAEPAEPAAAAESESEPAPEPESLPAADDPPAPEPAAIAETAAPETADVTMAESVATATAAGEGAESAALSFGDSAAGAAGPALFEPENHGLESQGLESLDQGLESLDAAPAAAPPPPPPAAHAPSNHGLESVIPKPSSAAALAAALPSYLIVEVGGGGLGLEPRAIKVTIEVTGGKPPFAGGYRDRRTGVEFVHGSTQTTRVPKYTEADRKLSRETQTFAGRTRKQQTGREAATQMVRRDVMMDHSGDVWRETGPYETADELAARQDAAGLCIQRYARGWFARRAAESLRAKREERRAFLEEEEARRIDKAEAKRRREIERRMHPRTAADFGVLYSELEAWRLQETHRIRTAGLGPDARGQALAQLLAKETKLLHTIDRLKTQANRENRVARVSRTLGDMAAPKRWEMCDGAVVVVHTPMTTRSNELMQLYHGLSLPLLSTDERLDVLLHVKWTVKEFDCNLTREIAELVDREADLLNRGRSAASLEGLRRRVANLFLQFVETPDFNPEAGRFQVVPGDFESSMRAAPGALVV